MRDSKNKIIGTWRLVHSMEVHENNKIHYPFGEDAIGCIIYDENGRMAVQICRKNRNKFESKSLKSATTTDALALTQDYLAYFGSYTIDEETQVVSHELEGHLCASFVGNIARRKMKFYDNKMSLRPYNDGTDREILWEKI